MPKALASAKRTYSKVKREVFDAYGNRCACCDETEPAFLTIDHIMNDGALHRKIIGRNNVYFSIRKQGFPKDRYQILCMNCNFGKRILGYCPHRPPEDLAEAAWAPFLVSPAVLRRAWTCLAACSRRAALFSGGTAVQRTQIYDRGRLSSRGQRIS